jgi:predicted cupin superfamily sugar epimerase
MDLEHPDWLRRLDLSPHPEGGWFRETWRSDLTVERSALPAQYDGPRSAGTAILFALLPGERSALHRVGSAELWFFHRGSPLALEVGADRSDLQQWVLGADLTNGEMPQFLVPAGYWQAAHPLRQDASLVSCVVVPGFDFADFELADPV